MWKDPIVEEVREQRREIEREFGNSFEEISARAREIQKAVTDRTSDRKPVRLPAPRGASK